MGVFTIKNNAEHPDLCSAFFFALFFWVCGNQVPQNRLRVFFPRFCFLSDFTFFKNTTFFFIVLTKLRKSRSLWTSTSQKWAPRFFPRFCFFVCRTRVPKNGLRVFFRPM